jgi:hypothetical protein
MELSLPERLLAVEVDFELDICRLIKQLARRELERIEIINFADQQIAVDGISILCNEDEVGEIIDNLQPKLLPRGYRIFWSNRRNFRGLTREELIVLKITDQFEIIRLKASNGLNNGISTEDIISKLMEWQTSCQVEVVGAAADWVAVRFHTLPADVGRFAEEVYQFCPDTVEQGIGLLREQDAPEIFAAAREFYPEISTEMKEYLSGYSYEFEFDLEGEAEFEETSTEMGIKLLAYQLYHSRYVFLWWD